ncbi:MAG TPA: phosphotransferase [Anaerolineae bacterium]|nr:phosphotransferase [Anaerolineae bacterium]
MTITIPQIFQKCQQIFPAWQNLTLDDFHFTDPKGFSSFTISIQAQNPTQLQAQYPSAPTAVLYRHLATKENAILNFDREKAVFLLLGHHNIAAHCYHYDHTCRLEAFYHGRTLTPTDLTNTAILEKIAVQLAKFHQLTPPDLPTNSFFHELYKKWTPLARHTIDTKRDQFPPNEQKMCADLMSILTPDTYHRVQACLPTTPLTFCHNDTYHGNIMLLDNGDIKLLDFEFSCLNHPAFDFANLFAETVMKHKQPDYPYFRIAAPEYTTEQITHLIAAYLDQFPPHHFPDPPAARAQLLTETLSMIRLSDYMYAMAALPLALEPIQKIRFIPYAHARFHKFLQTTA